MRRFAASAAVAVAVSLLGPLLLLLFRCNLLVPKRERLSQPRGVAVVAAIAVAAIAVANNGSHRGSAAVLLPLLLSVR